MTTIERIIKLMEQNNIKDAELERMLGLKPKIVYGWKKGRSKSYMDFIPQLTKIFRVSSEYLLCLSDNSAAGAGNQAPAMDFFRLEQLRKAQGVTNTFLCKLIGKSSAYIADSKNKNINIPAAYVEKWAEALHTTAAYLNGETDDPSAVGAGNPAPAKESQGLNQDERGLILDFRACSPDGRAKIIIYARDMRRLEEPEGVCLPSLDNTDILNSDIDRTGVHQNIHSDISNDR